MQVTEIGSALPTVFDLFVEDDAHVKSETYHVYSCYGSLKNF